MHQIIFEIGLYPRKRIKKKKIEARLFFKNGLGFEGYFQNWARPKKRFPDEQVVLSDS